MCSKDSNQQVICTNGKQMLQLPLQQKRLQQDWMQQGRAVQSLCGPAIKKGWFGK